MARKFLTPIDLSNLELRNFAIQNLTAAPATVKGALYFDSNTGVNNLKYYDGSSWLTVSTSAGTVTSVTGSSPVVSSGGTTPAISLASGYGDTQNPYGNKTQNWVLAASASNSTSTPTFRALVAGDIPTNLNGTTFSGNVAMGNNRITGLGEPGSPADAATKNYVDNVAQGVNVHDAVVGLISTQITGTYAIGSTTANPPGDGGTGVGATITYSSTGVITSSDSATPVTFVAGDRVLVTGGVSSGPATWTPAIANGIYVVTTAGAVGTAAVLTRATDADNSIFGDLAAGDLIYVAFGGTYSGTQWVQTTKGTATTGSGASLRYSVKISTDSIAYTQFSGNGAIPFATTSTAGIASFSSTYFTVNTGAVTLSSLGSLSTTGSAGSATTLTNSRQIWGQGFDGSQPVTGGMTGVTSIQGTTGSTLAITQPAVSTGTANSISITSGQHTSSTGTGGSITLTGGAATTGTSTASGGSITIRGGNANTTQGIGGSVYLYGGTGDASQNVGSQGNVYIGTSTTGLVSIGSSGNTSLTTDVYGTVNLHQVAPGSGTSFVKINYLQGQLSNATIAYSDLPTTSLTTATTTGIARKTSGTITGTGSTTAFTINHQYGQWVHAQLFDSSGNLVEVDIQNTVTTNGSTIFTFATAPTNGTVYNYVIIG
jgi:hypothetical protein